MRKVTKDYHQRPSSLQTGSRWYINALAGVHATGKWTDGSSKLYSRESVQIALGNIYHHKCAYCELKPKGSPPQVEHFRPKQNIANLDTHTGYYWLAYEWSNLLLACANCNTRKSNHFPIRVEANRVHTPTITNGSIDESANLISQAHLIAEEYMLLNPEVDEPDQHLEYDVHGKLISITDRGQVSIEKYDLNRDELYVIGRKKIIDDFKGKLYKRLDYYHNKVRSEATVIEDINLLIRENIIAPIQNEESFTNFYKKFLLNFESIIIEDFKSPIDKSILKQGYIGAIIPLKS